MWFNSIKHVTNQKVKAGEVQTLAAAEDICTGDGHLADAFPPKKLGHTEKYQQVERICYEKNYNYFNSRCCACMRFVRNGIR